MTPGSSGSTSSPPSGVARPSPRGVATSALADALGDPALADVDAVARAFDTDPATGLTSAEAARRLALDGPNALRATPPTRWWRRLLAQLHDPLVYLLLLAMAVSLAAWAYEGAAGWPVDAIVIAVVVVLNAALGYAQEAKARKRGRRARAHDRGDCRGACATARC